jgi:pimeloyl-ACP methyl ester carboxylesterase
MAGTLVRPAGDGPFPAVVFVAGSGPTDRDWCSPLLPGSNGSARLLADQLADAGIASLRYDKRVSGPRVLENAQALFGKLTMQSHLDELSAAISVLAEQSSVDGDRIAGFGNSEGTLHLLHYAAQPRDVSLAGLILAAPPGRPLGAILRAQLALQAAQVPGGDALVPLVEAALVRYEAAEPINPDPRIPESVRMVLASFETPANQPFARELFTEDAAAALANVTIPTLVVIGRKDVQVDAVADGGPLQQTAAGMDNVTFVFPDNANHVLKQDLRSPAEVLAAPGIGYNEDDTKLDPEALETIIAWLNQVLMPSR